MQYAWVNEDQIRWAVAWVCFGDTSVESSGAFTMELGRCFAFVVGLCLGCMDTGYTGCCL